MATCLQTPQHRRRPGTPVAAALATAALLVGLLAPLPAARATTAEDETTVIGSQDTAPPVRLVVASLQAVVGPPDQPERLPEDGEPALPPADVTARLLVENRTEEPLVDARIVVELETPTIDRADLRARLDGASPGPVRTTVLVDRAVPTIASGGVAQLRVELPGTEWAFTPAGEAGAPPVWIRPLVLSVVRGSRVLDEARTAVVGLAGTDAPPLEAAVVLPLATEPGPTPPPPDDGADDEEGSSEEPAADADPPPPVDEDLLPGGRVDRLVSAVEAVTPGTVAIAPAAHTLEALAAAQTATGTTTPLLDRVRTIAQADRDSLVSTPFALAAVPVLAADDDTSPLASGAISEGRRRLGSVVGSAPGTSHLTVTSQTPASIDLVPVDLLVTRWDDAGGVDLEADPTSAIPPAVRTAITSNGRQLQVLVGDPWTERALAEASAVHGYALDAHRVVLETAALWATRPTAAGRVVAVVPPVGWETPGDLATELTTRLAAAPWLRLAAPVAVVQRASSTSTGWVPTPVPQPDLLGVLPLLGTVANRVEAVASSVPEGAPDPIPGRDDDLLRAVTAWPTLLPALRAQALIASVDEAVDEALGTVSVPVGTTVTLASEEGTIPVTLRREAGPSIDVVVEVRPQGRLLVEGEDVRRVTLEEDGTATVGFEARALGTGSFPLSVRVVTPDGGEQLAGGLVSVRATAVSTPALVAIGLVVVILLVLGRRRRSDDDHDRPRLEVVR